MSTARVAIALLLLLGAGAIGYRRYEASLLSPLAIGTVRPGMRFSDAEDEAQREMRHGYTCKDIDGGVQLCRLVTDGPIGVLEHVVDKSGRVAVIRFLISDSTIATQQIGHRQGAAWNHVHEGDVEPSDTSDTNWETWRTPDDRWTAEMSWRRGADAPGVMKSTDERRLQQLAESNPAALHTLLQ